MQRIELNKGVILVRMLSLIFFALTSISLHLSANELFTCVSSTNNKANICNYQVLNKDLYILAQEIKYSLDPLGEIPTTDGFLLPDIEKRTIKFWHNDPEILESIKEMLVQLDKPNIMEDREKVSVRLNFYFLSNSLASSKGFNFSFLTSGVVNPDVSVANGSAGEVGLNLGNLTKDILSLNLEYAGENDVIVNTETVEYFSYHGYNLGFSESKTVYRDGAINTDGEVLGKNVSGQILLPDDAEDEIHIDQFVMSYPIESDDSRSLQTAKKFSGDYIKFKSGVPYVVVNQSIEVEKNSYLNGILSRKNIKGESQVQFIATATFYRGRDIVNRPKDKQYNLQSKLFKYNQSELDTLLPGDRDSLKNIFDRNNFNASLIMSPIGISANRLAIQIDKSIITQNTAKSYILVELKGSGLNYKRTLQLENLSAGPYVLPSFPLHKVKAAERKKGKLKFKLRMTLDNDMKNLTTHKNLQNYVVEYKFIYLPDISALEVLDYKLVKKNSEIGRQR